MNDSQHQATLILHDGTTFPGRAFGFLGHPVAGEVVFTTGMVGYPESLTDPSYQGQLLVFTYPLIGNYGVPRLQPQRGPQNNFESGRVHATAVIVSSTIDAPSHYQSAQTFGIWLKRQRVLGLSGVDTRALTQRLREKGTMLGKIIFDRDIPWYDPNKENLVAQVSITQPRHYPGKGKRIVVLDCGVKHGILRGLRKRLCDIRQIPWDFPVSSLRGVDGVVVSNGPGDPLMASATVREIKKLIARKIPLWGICLGHQLLALALGAKTYKLPYGHRSHNQPVLDLETGKAYITSQNHGYAVRERTLPKLTAPWFRNLNDGTNEGFRHRALPIIAVQFHPEASPGPEDTGFLFDEFLSLC